MTREQQALFDAYSEQIEKERGEVKRLLGIITGNYERLGRLERDRNKLFCEVLSAGEIR